MVNNIKINLKQYVGIDIMKIYSYYVDLCKFRP